MGLAVVVGVTIYCVRSKARKRVTRDNEKAAMTGKIETRTRLRRYGHKVARKRSTLTQLPPQISSKGVKAAAGPRTKLAVQPVGEAYQPSSEAPAAAVNVTELMPEKTLNTQFHFPSWKRIARLSKGPPRLEPLEPLEATGVEAHSCPGSPLHGT